MTAPASTFRLPLWARNAKRRPTGQKATKRARRRAQREARRRNRG